MDDQGRISAFHPHPRDPVRYYANLVNAALYAVNRRELEPWRHPKGPVDFGKDLFPAMLDRGRILLGYPSPEYIKDCGTPGRLDKVRARLHVRPRWRAPASTLRSRRPSSSIATARSTVRWGTSPGTTSSSCCQARTKPSSG